MKTLFDLPPEEERKPVARARNSDPNTSHLAADYVEQSGVATAQREKCLVAVLQNPGHTAAEIAVLTGLQRHAPSRRLPELRECGLVKNGETRICRVQKRVSITWFPTEEIMATE